MRHLIAALILLAGLMPAMAQDLPQWQSTTLNDFAGALTPEDAGALERALTGLRDETGVQGTVVTLSDRARHGGTEGLEAFATRLFNHWGVGEPQRNNGFMLLVLTDTREARIELGRGYENDADLMAQDILRGTVLPAFRDGRISQGIRQGTEDIIAHIVRPTIRGEALERPSGPLAPKLIGLGLWAAFTALLGRHLWRRNRCPQCGRRGLATTRHPHRQTQRDGSYQIAADEVTRHCPDCGWSDTRRRPNRDTVWYDGQGNRLRSARNRGFGRGADGSGDSSGGGSGGGFGGGGSRGGGASGRW